MAWSAPPTFADAAILTAAQLNILSDDVEYLYGLVSGVNTPFNSITTTSNLRSNNNQWLLRHAYQYLHFKARTVAGTNDDFDIFITHPVGNDIRVYEYSSSQATYSGYIDLEDLTTWTTAASGDADIYRGVWVTSTSYGEYDIVAHDDGGGTDYYVCPSGESHTSGTFATDLAAGKWINLGTSTNLWTDGTRYQMYVYTNLNGSYTFTVDYLLESDATSL